MKRSNLWMVLSGILAALLIISIFTSGFGRASSNDAAEDNKDVMNPQEAADKAIAYINANLLQGGTAATAGAVEESGNLYNIKLDIGGREYDSYVTKDGSLLFPSAVDLNQKIEIPVQQNPEEESKSAEELCDGMEKAEKPKLEVFYVSRCPFGVQAINSLYYVAKNLGDSAEVIPRLLVNIAADGKSTTSMHGAEEHKEDLRHICLREEQPDAYWGYINCYAETGKTVECEETADVDSDKLADCYENSAEGYALKDAEDWKNIHQPKQIALKGGAGSPSFSLNGEAISEYDFSSNGRSPENIKTIICCSMKEKAEECDNTLQTAQPPRGFGEIEAGSDEGSEELNC
ncbi:hypothetical protein KY358_02645 [Candidatus Woesearchaeota archaeon]|nr:hypothetical protein [Candidatus Woesearchaeota archaeon]